jgi:hypothetical protein
MSIPNYATKHYASASKRLLQSQIAHFFEVNFPRTFGPDIRDRIAQQLMALVEAQLPATANLRPGQCLWNAVAIDTRADSPKLRLVPVVLTLVDETDIVQLVAGVSPAIVAQDSLARIMREAFAQGALLSMRDIGLLTWRRHSSVTVLRQHWEERHEQLLPHPGNLQDMGSCITHKAAIVAKVVYEKKDPLRVAQETGHTPEAVDHYLRDFHRVRTSYRHRPEEAFICQVTGMSPDLVQQYIRIIEQHEGKVAS